MTSLISRLIRRNLACSPGPRLFELPAIVRAAGSEHPAARKNGAHPGLKPRMRCLGVGYFLGVVSATSIRAQQLPVLVTHLLVPGPQWKLSPALRTVSPSSVFRVISPSTTK